MVSVPKVKVMTRPSRLKAAIDAAGNFGEWLLPGVHLIRRIA